jgi:predicted O-methyltransferase YrrM
MATKSELLARVPPLYRLGRALKEGRRAHTEHRDNAKRALLRDVARRHGLRVLVETGTYMGETAWALRRDFDRIETIELEPTLARLARIRFGRKARVQVHEGDSATVLPRILDALEEPALFWLDAHPSTDRTARDAPIPLRAELAAIAGHPVAGHVVLIDDLQYAGTPGYPALDELSLPGYRFEDVRGVAVLTPA